MLIFSHSCFDFIKANIFFSLYTNSGMYSRVILGFQATGGY